MEKEQKHRAQCSAFASHLSLLAFLASQSAAFCFRFSSFASRIFSLLEAQRSAFHLSPLEVQRSVFASHLSLLEFSRFSKRSVLLRSAVRPAIGYYKPKLALFSLGMDKAFWIWVNWF